MRKHRRPGDHYTLPRQTARLSAMLCGSHQPFGAPGLITTLANHSVGIKTIMELAGHKQLSTTQKYIEVTPDAKRKAVELIIR